MLASIVIGVLASLSLGGLVVFCVAGELAAIPLILVVRARTPAGRPGARVPEPLVSRRRRDG